MLGLHQQYPELSQIPMLSSSSPPRPVETTPPGTTNGGGAPHQVSVCPNTGGTSSSPINLASATFPFKTEPGLLEHGNSNGNPNNGYGNGPLPSMVGTAALQAAANAANIQQANNNATQAKKEKSKKSNDNGTKKKKTR